MITASELQMLRNANSSAVLPGIDTKVGNQLAASSLLTIANLPAGVYFNAANNMVVVSKSNTNLTGYNFGNATLYINGANNVTVTNCTFGSSKSYYSLFQEGNSTGLVVQNCTFVGSPNPSSQAGVFINAMGGVTIKNCSLVDAASSAIHVMSNAVVTGNYIEGGGYQPGSHADGIVVYGGSNVAISNNFVDWTANADQTNPGLGSAVVTDAPASGVSSNISVSGNYLVGGGFGVDIRGPSSSYSNINVANNYIGFGLYGAFTTGANHTTGDTNVTLTNNTVFDYTNPIFSAEAWTAYLASGIKTANFVSSTGANISASATGSTTLYGNGQRVDLFGTKQENVFVGGQGAQYIFCGVGANIITELAPSDGTDFISSFDATKDVIDLSRMDGDITKAGVQNLTFVGTSAFSSSGGGQVRYQQDVANNCTYVQVALAGDASGSAPDLTLKLYGLYNLSASNFALTAAQSTAAVADGASLTNSGYVIPKAGNVREWIYTNVKDRSYTSYESFRTGTTLAESFNLSSSSNKVVISAGGVTVSRGGGTESLQSGTSVFSLPYHATETIQAASVGSDTFALSKGFGNETINNFGVSGAGADTLQLSTSAFSYLNSGMTQAQDLAAVLSHATAGSSSVTITDTSGDSLTLNGLTKAAITANPSQFHFV